MSTLEVIPLSSHKTGDDAPSASPEPIDTAQIKALPKPAYNPKAEAFREEQSGWVCAMYTELINDAMGVLPDEDVCKLLELYEQTQNVLQHSVINEEALLATDK